jgi:hypothetical protein
MEWRRLRPPFFLRDAFRSFGEGPLWRFFANLARKVLYPYLQLVILEGMSRLLKDVFSLGTDMVAWHGCGV